MSKTEKYTINNLLNDNHFIEWVNSKNGKSNAYWEEIRINLKEEEKADFEKAIQIINKIRSLNIDDPKSFKSPEFIQDQYIRLLEATSVKNSPKIKVNPIYNLLKYAAAIILLISIPSAIFLLNNSANSFDKHLVATKYNTSDILIQTSEDEYFKISDDTSNKWLMKNGVFVSIDSEKIKFIATDDVRLNKIDEYKIIIPKGKKYHLSLIDGTDIELNSNSSLTFNNSVLSDYRMVDLTGEAFFEVEYNKTRPFIVQSSDLKIEVLGTEFNVSNYDENGYVSTTLVNGSIKVSNPEGENEVIQPGDQAKLFHNQNEIIVNKTDVQKVTAWTMGRMIFSNEKLENLIPQLNRWYDVNFVIVGDDLQDYRFTGTLKKENELIHFLQMLKYTEGISYEIIGGKVKLFLNK